VARELHNSLTGLEAVTMKESEEAKEDEAQQDSCFTIMPFGGWFDNYYEDIYRPAVIEAGLVPHRADDVYRPGTIVHDIWQFTKEAKVILADLTGKNPNVLYELGLAHALAKPAIIVTESLDDIPFDLRALRIVEYDKEAPDWGQILEAKITRSLKEVHESPLKAILPAFLEVEPSKESKKVGREEKEILELRQEIDLLRQEMRVSRGGTIEETIDPETARRMIQELVQKRLTTDDIVRRMRRYGPPTSWIIHTVEEIKREGADDEIPF
jgi:hypothetical protein